jgi:hypothetical protein
MQRIITEGGKKRHFIQEVKRKKGRDFFSTLFLS